MIKLRDLLLEKTLYHGTTVNNAEDIKKYGLIPQRGDFVSTAYGGEYNTDNDFEQGVPELTFAADKKGLQAAVTAATHHVANKLNKSFHEVSDQDFIRYAVIIIIKNGDEYFSHRPKDDDNYRGEYPTSVEPGDYYSNSGVSTDMALTGQPLVKLLRQHKLWPRTYGKITSEKTKGQMRGYLIQYGIHVGKHKKEDIIRWINGLDDNDLKSTYNKYAKED